MVKALANNEEISPGSPLRLSIAAKLAYPDGSMTASGLRREAARGRLIVERIANKDFTTLATIAGMPELYQLDPKVHDCDSGPKDESGVNSFVVQSGSSSMVGAKLAYAELRPSRRTLRARDRNPPYYRVLRRRKLSLRGPIPKFA